MNFSWYTIYKIVKFYSYYDGKNTVFTNISGCIYFFYLFIFLGGGGRGRGGRQITVSFTCVLIRVQAVCKDHQQMTKFAASRQRVEYRDHKCFFMHNICRVPTKLFEHESVRPSVQTSSEGPGKYYAMKQTCVIVILAYFT